MGGCGGGESEGGRGLGIVLEFSHCPWYLLGEVNVMTSRHCPWYLLGELNVMTSLHAVLF